MRIRITLAALLLTAACDAAANGGTAPTAGGGSPMVLSAIAPQAAEVGRPFSFDAARAFGPSSGLTFTVAFTPSANGFAAVGARIEGTPLATGVTTATVTATNARGERVAQSFPIVAFAAGLPTPALPIAAYAYSDARVPLPSHFTTAGPAGLVIAEDNTPTANPTTDAGASLGRVLFYDRRLSVNDRVSCGSCHLQSAGFADTARLSHGVAGGLTGRRAMSLANGRFYRNGRFFWDERAATLENQVLQPIQNPVEMGMTLENLVLKVRATSFYAPLFREAFGSSDVSADRISRALAQYVRALHSTDSRFDQAFNGTPNPNGFAGLTPQERQGQQLFVGVGCAACHTTNAQVANAPHNIGLDAVSADTGAGRGRFKVPSLRNVAVRAPYMHDGRFGSLQQVVGFYDSGVQPNPNLDPRLRAPDGSPRRLNLTAAQRDALVVYLGTLTDPTFLTAAKFADPFAR